MDNQTERGGEALYAAFVGAPAPSTTDL